MCGCRLVASEVSYPGGYSWFDKTTHSIFLLFVSSCGVASDRLRRVQALFFQTHRYPNNRLLVVFPCFWWVTPPFLPSIVDFRMPSLTFPSNLRKPTTTHQCSTDFLVFVIIVWVGRRSTGFTRSRVPSILDRIVRDATMYFLVIFTSHLIVECFLVFAPVSRRTPWTDSCVSIFPCAL